MSRFPKDCTDGGGGVSILIKGMEMPKSCESCPCKTADAFGGLGCQATGYIPLRKADQDRPDWCPLVQLPPHGRLIDADALMLEIKEYIEEYDELDENGYHNLKWCAMKEAEATIENAHTVIEAEGEE